MGSVLIEATFSEGCGNVNVLVAPLQTGVGYQVTLKADALRAQRYAWELIGPHKFGFVLAPNARETAFECTEGGSGILKLAMRGEKCEDIAEIPLTCVAPSGS